MFLSVNSKRLVERGIAVFLTLAPSAGAYAVSPPRDGQTEILGFTSEGSRAQRSLEEGLDRALRPEDLRSWMETMSSAPNQVGSPNNKANAELTLRQFREWGWDAKIETYHVLFPTPEALTVELISPVKFKARLTEPPLEGDRTSSLTKDVLPAYVTYGGDGDVTAELVYVNYGMPRDYETLARNGIDVKGKIVIARYGGGWRGLKPKLAQQHGAVGCIIYSDPIDDGYGSGVPYPAGGGRPADGVQRGSVLDEPVRPGDPLTPGIGAHEKAGRLSVDDAETVWKIPVVPISYAGAEPLLRELRGNVAPRAWRGALPHTYQLGPGPAKVRLAVRSDWSLKPIYNVVAKIAGSDNPDEWIIRGNHRDAWVFGASDPLSGHVAMMAEAKAIGGLVRTGWRPKRTIVYASWDGEEPGLLGSTEWVEDHADELSGKAALYINSDVNGRGFLTAGGTAALRRAISDIAAEVPDPQTGVSVGDRLRARLLVAGSELGASESNKQDAAAINRGDDLPLEALGSGSDFTPFLQHAGIPSVQIYYSGENESSGVYHSAYDSFDHYTRLVDPNFHYGVTLGKTIGRLVLRAANADILPFDFLATAESLATFAREVKTLSAAETARVQNLNRLLLTNAHDLAADRRRVNVAPKAVAEGAALDFELLDKAVSDLRARADRYSRMRNKALTMAKPREHDRLNRLLAQTEQAVLDVKGLPGRPWYRNLLYAPGMYTGYSVKTLPGIREAIEGHRWAEAQEMIQRTANAITRLNAILAQAAKALKVAQVAK